MSTLPSAVRFAPARSRSDSIRRIGGALLLPLALLLGVAGAAAAFFGAALLGLTAAGPLLALAAVTGFALAAALSVPAWRLMSLRRAAWPAVVLGVVGGALSAGAGWYGAVRQPAYPPSFLTPAGSLAEVRWIPVQWEELTLGARRFDRAALYVPVRLNGLPETYFLQLDTGAPATMLYERPLAQLAATYPALGRRLDREDPAFRVAGHDLLVFTGATLRLNDEVDFTAAKLPVLPEFGDTWDVVGSPERKVIGTLGADAFANAVLLIDYERSRIAVTTTPPSEAEFSFVATRVEHGRFTLPLEVDGRREEFLFDTGASLFSIITPQAAWTRLTKGEGAETIPGVTSWGVDHTVSGAAPRAEVRLGGRVLHPERIYAHPAPFFVLFPIRYSVTGLVGNELFRHDIVALDFQQHRFGLWRS